MSPGSAGSASRPNQRLFQELSKTRLLDARTLLEHGRAAAAYYMGGYVIECALKACIAKQTRQGDYPPDRRIVEKCYSHEIEKLCELARVPLKEKQSADKLFESYWGVIKDWSEQARYTQVDDTKARDLLRAIDDPQHGAFQWLREHW